MKKRKIVLQVLLVLILIIAIGSTIAYFILKPEKAGLAFYVVCCGGVLIVNLLLCMFFVHKNFR